ncbi:MAG: NADH-quinone oxidoreductase subunit NuoH [Verrucomicrobia bacterium]|nr:NADH-quinone oxidoreductase subunit NuoH [Verrucomicrobiota bacterium]
MGDAVDQVFVLLKHWLLGFCPGSLQPLASILLSIIPILLTFPLLFAVTTILERKGLGRIQNRYGPNRVGPCGLFQPVADGLKMIIKEDIVPRAADKVVHFLAPLALIGPVFLAFSVLPFGRNMAAIDLDAGLLFFFAVGAGSELAVFMAGWSSRNKYSLLGAMRAIAQMVSYEVPLILSSVTVVMLVGSLSPIKIVEAQSGYIAGLPQWHIFSPWGLAGFILFMIAAAAEANRTPFDIPEGESEIIAGYLVEYSGFKFALFFLGEYLGLFAICGLGITLFLGGWNAPFAFLQWIPSYAWFFAKLLALIFLFIWMRGTLPRLRMDQLMGFAWRFVLPMTLLNIPVAAAWHYSRAWEFPAADACRWAMCLAILAFAYVRLGRGLKQGRKYGKRIYRFAD